MNKIVVTKDNRQQVRAYYFSLCDQGKANFLYDNDISGGHLMLSPSEYPKSAPEHRLCDCGGTPILEQQQGFDKYDTYAICPNCGCRTTKQQTPYWAWKAWDNKELKVTDSNLTIWEMM